MNVFSAKTMQLKIFMIGLQLIYFDKIGLSLNKNQCCLASIWAKLREIFNNYALIELVRYKDSLEWFSKKQILRIITKSVCLQRTPCALTFTMLTNNCPTSFKAHLRQMGKQYIISPAIPKGSHWPISRTIFHRNSNLMEISFRSHPSCREGIAMKLCTWHDGCAVVQYDNLWLKKFHRIRITMEKSSVKWAPGICLGA